MRNSLTISILCAASALCGQAPAGYELFWADEFEGDALNKDVWAYRVTPKFRSVQLEENVTVEDGKLRIALNKEEGEIPWSGGGVISRRKFGHGPGYHEVRAKISPVRGWHESFWTTPHLQDSSVEAENQTFAEAVEMYGDWVEFDVMEHYGYITSMETTFGAIHWLDDKELGDRKVIIREKLKSEFDMGKDYHTYGFEHTPEYAIFYIDGEIVGIQDMRTYPYHAFHAWLSCIASNGTAPEGPSEMFYDYFRSYTISAEAYEVRRAEVMAIFNEMEEAEAKLRAQDVSNGNDLWMEAENFPELGFWIDRPSDDEPFERTARAINGRGGKGDYTKEQLSARGVFEIEESGEYRLWVRAWDDTSGEREWGTFNVLVNGEESKSLYGTHGKGAFAWQDGGTFKLEKGTQAVVIYDSSQSHARCDMLLLTTDLDFVPSSIGGEENVEYINKSGTLSSMAKFGW